MKFRATMTAVVGAALYNYFNIPEEIVDKIMTSIWIYVGAQGLADLGKNKL